MSISIKAVLFDMDDTLYDERTFAASGFRAVAAYLADRFPVDPQGILSAMMGVFRAEGRGKVFDKTLKRYGLYSPSLVEELVGIYRSHRPQITLYSDVVPAFHTLKRHGTKLGIVTDGLHSVQKRKVAALGLTAMVDVIVYTDELGNDYCKPHPVAFQRAIETLAVKPTEAAYVGNDPAKDFAGPNFIGMLTIHVQRDGNLEETDCEAPAHISDLAALILIIVGRERRWLAL